MKKIMPMAIGLVLLGSLAGCAHPYARLSTHQDPKFPIVLTNKIALPDSINSSTVDLNSRLAGETLREQLQALGFTITTAAAADLQLNFTITEKDEPVTFNQTVPVMSTVTGMAGPRLVSGTVMTDQVVPETHMVEKTQLNVTLQRTQDPPVEVWSGHISADTSDMENFRTAYFRALLERIGETANGVVQLDSNQPATKP